MSESQYKFLSNEEAAVAEGLESLRAGLESLRIAFRHMNTTVFNDHTIDPGTRADLNNRIEEGRQAVKLLERTLKI